jgi:hypothetical protein
VLAPGQLRDLDAIAALILPIPSKRRAWRRSADFWRIPSTAATRARRAIGFDDRFVWAEPFGWYDGEGAAGE